MNKLEESRIKIDEIDTKMRELFEARMEAVRVVAEYKKENAMPIFDEKRENAVIIKNCEKLENSELKHEYVYFLQSLMKSSKLYQRKLVYGGNIGYQGALGSCGHIASGELFEGAELKAYKKFGDVLDAVENGEIDAGVLPIENSINGEVGEVMDELFKHENLYINAYYDLKVDQNLLGIPGARLEDIKKVYSHEQALGQCSMFFRGKDIELIPYVNTARAAEYVKSLNDKSVACVASLKTKDIYGLELIEEKINNSDTNTTRFGIISKNYSGHGDKFGLYFVVNNSAGSLAKAINIISDTGFNMTCLRSRAMKDLPWEYYFYVEVSGNLEDANDMLTELKKVCARLRILGSYKKITI